MRKLFNPIELSNISVYPLKDRLSKVKRSDFAGVYSPGCTVASFLKSFPNILAASDLRDVASAIASAFHSNKTVALAMGAHVIKVGLNPIIIDLMQRGIISAIAMNGAGIIHDTELAMTGNTSEDVQAALADGSFGMAEDTAGFLNNAIKFTSQNNIGLGEGVGKALLSEGFQYNCDSILATGAEIGIPVTVHIGIGTDIIHIHPGFDAAAAGTASHNDFRLFASVVSSLEEGVYLNVGSAVILPEVFLKAITLARNLGHKVERFTAVNMDFIRQYRPLTNVVQRPTLLGGKGYSLVGHHEIMFPLLVAAILEEIEIKKMEETNAHL
ncbi:MAG: hypothetical protein V1753_10785 [Pseudomonadota bacterium]